MATDDNFFISAEIVALVSSSFYSDSFFTEFINLVFSPFSSSRVQRNRLLSSEVKTRLWFYFEFSKAAAAAAAAAGVVAAAAADVEVFGVL